MDLFGLFPTGINLFPLNNNLIKAATFFAVVVLLLAVVFILFSNKHHGSGIIKKIKESAITKVVISIISGSIAWFVPWPSIKIHLQIISLVFLFSIFAGKAGLSPFKTVLIVLLVLIIAAGIAAPFFYTVNTPINTRTTDDIKFPDFVSRLLNEGNNYLPDKEMSLKYIDHITIDIDSGIGLDFTDDDILYYPANLNVQEKDGKLIVSAPHAGKKGTYVIKVGTATSRSMDIICEGIKVSGTGKFSDFSLSCAGASINADIFSENNIRIDSAGLNINGKLEGKRLEIESAGSNINGELSFESIQLNSAGTNINVKGLFDSFHIDATGITGTIEVLNSAARSARLYVNSTGGSLTVGNPNNAAVDIQHKGYIKIHRK